MKAEGEETPVSDGTLTSNASHEVSMHASLWTGWNWYSAHVRRVNKPNWLSADHQQSTRSLPIGQFVHFNTWRSHLNNLIGS